MVQTRRDNLFSPLMVISQPISFANRPKFASNNRTTGTPEENEAAVRGSNSSFGTYEISSDGSITLHIVGSTFPNWDGTKQKRLAAIKGDEITWTNPTPSIGGNMVIHCNVRSSGSAYPQRDEKLGR